MRTQVLREAATGRRPPPLPPTFSVTRNRFEIAFDPAKDTANIARHGLSLAFCARRFADDAFLVPPSVRPVDGEERFKAIGMVDGKRYTAVHVRRGDAVRFISVRRSNDGEERIYHRP